ncbi:MAG: beta-ketoacyl-[acyl-carrier-protein] synthase family protein [Sedimentisphaeraceae bacterium JB056]
MQNRVVITGMGLVSPMGCSVDTVWEGILTGKDGFNEISVFDASTFPTKFCAEVKNFELSEHISTAEKHKHGLRATGFAIAAAAQACRQAGIDIETDAPADNIDRKKIGIYMGSGEGPTDHNTFFNAIVESYDKESSTVDWAKWAKATMESMEAIGEIEQEPNMPAGHIAMLTGARGPVRSCLTACAASTQAIGEATMMIRQGRSDIMIAGGSHSMIHPLGITGFNRLTALSTRNDDIHHASRPFSGSRDGFVIGEGSAVMILESLESATKRGAKILAEVIGYGSSSDAFRVTDMHDEARGGCAAITAALKDAGITTEDVDYINAHGTSTKENDSIETLAIKTVFGDKAKDVAVSSVKSMLGHLIGSAGAAELITCVKAIENDILPPTANYQDPDPELDLDYVPNEPRKAEVNIAMSESFGFGGQNDVVIVKKYID